jgi:hypothetical protein
MRELPPLPKHRLGRPRDDRRYPIPYTVLIRPDGSRTSGSSTRRRPGMRGKPAAAPLFAIQTCPHLTLPKAQSGQG